MCIAIVLFGKTSYIFFIIVDDWIRPADAISRSIFIIVSYYTCSAYIIYDGENKMMEILYVHIVSVSYK